MKTEDDYGYEYERFFSYFVSGELKAYMEAAGLTLVVSSASLSGHTTWLQAVGQKPLA